MSTTTSSAPHVLEKHPKWTPREGPVCVIILDGFGVDKPGPGNAVVQADMKYYNSLLEEAKQKKLFSLIKAHGPAVGLPTEGDMGNSEVGHNALGCGQVYSQGTKLVDESLETGDFFKTKNWDTVVGSVARNPTSTLHFFGLFSDGNVHSHTSQVYKMIKGAIQTGVKKIRLHILLDGRDVAPDSGLKYIDDLESHLVEIRKQGVDIKIASGGGRMYITMDRYESDWSIVKRGWDCHVRGVVAETDITPEYKGYFSSAREAVECARKVFPKKLDQFNPPFVVVGEDGKPIGKMHDGDSVINFNFRGDRAIQISKAFDQEEFKAFDRVERPKVHYAGLMEYDTEWHIPSLFLVPPPSIKHISSEYIVNSGVSCYALAETHKFGHMTYFWNGNRSGYINEKLECYEEVRSLPNEMTESHPEMKAREVTDKLLAAINSGKYKYIRVNYANPDMVGHTGNIPACIEALHVIDKILAEVVPAIIAKKGVALITADHGNIEQMLDKTGAVMTSHTTNPVNFIVVDPQYKGEYVVDASDIKQPGLTNVTATYINMLGFKEPSMYAPGLVKFL